MITMPCPCGRSDSYEQCCGRFHQGMTPDTAEQLMRSRFTAFQLMLEDYVRDTWFPGTCPHDLSLDRQVLWSSLKVSEHCQVGNKATVSFDATFYQVGQEAPWGTLRELSRFVLEEGRWWYVDGDAEWLSLRPGRNDPCPCGSGNKYKKCCALDNGVAYSESARRAFENHAPSHHQSANNGSNQ